MEKTPYKGPGNLSRLWNSTLYSWNGLKATFKAEPSFRLELLAAAILIPLTFFLPVNGIGRALMIASILLVLILELLNSAIEAIVDRISLEQHPLSKRAKDIGSAAVLLGLINVCVVWGCVLFG